MNPNSPQAQSPATPAPLPPQPTQSGPNAKAAVMDRLQSASNILVAVSSNPTIDQLSAAIAMTLLLEKYKKNATAVFSGKVPSAISFLNPKERFEKTTDSLRDFIISIDKSKADKLRYKVEDDVVKIFITPYKTSITEKDLQYNAGDFNVDVIVALGVHRQEDLDAAITAHGRIFHDAVVLSINNEAGGNFGVANWENYDASSLSELIAELAQSLGQGMLDTDIATALLTGIVAETNRFSNAKTHPGTMNVSSILLEAGADQQLVNQQLASVIGTMVNLAAGSEIKPTEVHSDDDNAEAPEELVIGSDGSLQDKDADEGASSDFTIGHDAEAAEPEIPEPEFIETPVAAAPPIEVVPPAEEVSQALLGSDVPPTPAPVLDEEPSADVLEPEPEEARQAIDEAIDAQPAPAANAPMVDLGGATLPLSEPLMPFDPELVSDAAAPTVPTEAPSPYIPPSPTIQPGSGAFANLSGQSPAGSQPAIQPIAPNQPSYSNPATMTNYNMPPVPPAAPANESAPLGNSPADQAFTMPLPPASSMAQPSATPWGQPAANPIAPPPLPPPMPPSGV